MATRTARHGKTSKDWHVVWNRALNNLPCRIRHSKEVIAHEAEEPVPIGDFIAGEAKGTMKMINGKVHHLEVIIHEHQYGRQALLTYTAVAKTRGNKVVYDPNRVYQNMTKGHAPKDPARRALLLALANPKRGHLLACELTVKLGLAKRYGLSEV